MLVPSTTSPAILDTFPPASVRIGSWAATSLIDPLLGHYVENTGNTTLRYIEVFRTDKFQDVSLNQWLALTPPELVKAHLGFSDATIAKLQKVKPVVAAPFQVQL
jgi:oxalate decarboxylase/phosphoglucose isomerase-like protein (cupin superfamily)